MRPKHEPLRTEMRGKERGRDEAGGCGAVLLGFLLIAMLIFLVIKITEEKPQGDNKATVTIPIGKKH